MKIEITPDQVQQMIDFFSGRIQFLESEINDRIREIKQIQAIVDQLESPEVNALPGDRSQEGPQASEVPVHVLKLREAIIENKKPIEPIEPDNNPDDFVWKNDVLPKDQEPVREEIKFPEPKEKNQNAAALGKLGGVKGGPARAEALSPERRSEIAKKAGDTRWGNEPREPKNKLIKNISEANKLDDILESKKTIERPPAKYSNNKSLYPELESDKSF